MNTFLLHLRRFGSALCSGLPPVGWLLCALSLQPLTGLGQSTAFTYQGRLNAGGLPANGAYDFQFRLYDELGGAGPVWELDSINVSNGLFTVQVDFATNYFTGPDRSLEVATRPSHSGPFTVLSPRQPITPTPYALFAQGANASNLVGQVPDVQLSANIARLSSSQSFAGTVSATSFSGNGGGLTNLSLAALNTTGSVVPLAWGNNANGQASPPPGLSNVTSVAVGGNHSLALRADGTVAAWGDNSAGQTSVPITATNVIAIAAGLSHSLALRSNGTLVAWGDNGNGQTTIPPLATGVIAVSCSDYNSAAVRSGGTVLVWGDDSFGQAEVPGGLGNVTAVALGDIHCLALRSNGTVVAWGDNTFGEATVPGNATNVSAIAAGGSHSLALKNDGTVVAWGDNSSGQSTVPTNLNNVVAIAAGAFHSVALKRDGSLLVWGDNSFGQANVPASLNAVRAVAQGSAARHVLVLHPQLITAATLVEGKLPDTALSGNLALLNANQTFTAQNAFAAGNVVIGAPGEQLLSLNVVPGYGEGMEIDSANPGHTPALYLNHINGGGRRYRLASYADGTGPGRFVVRDDTVGADRFTIGSTGAVYADGSGLTNLTAGNLASGTVPDSRLSANVALLNGNQTFTGNNSFAPGSLGFGNTTRQMLNLWSTQYGIGVQSFTLYFRVDNGASFSWFKGGVHSDAQNNPGGGTELMRLDANGALSVRSVVATNVNLTSDRAAKEHFTPVDGQAVLAKVAALPLSAWSFKTEPGIQHLGPMAQDFYAAFHLGEDDRHIAVVDEGGVALAAIQALHTQVAQKEAELERLKQQNTALERRLSQVEAALAGLTSRGAEALPKGSAP